MNKFLILIILIMTSNFITASNNLLNSNQKETFVLIHGAWGGGWQFERVKDMLHILGHDVYSPTLDGMAFKYNETKQGINLNTHIQQITSFILDKNLDNVILLGHSYGGMVISGVASNIPARIKHLIYLDAFVPNVGESVEQIAGSDSWNKFLAPHIRDGYIHFPFGKNHKPLEKSSPLPLQCFTQKIDLDDSNLENLRVSYINMTAKESNTFQYWGMQRAISRKWEVIQLDGSHYVMMENPSFLTQQIINIARVDHEFEIINRHNAKIIPVDTNFTITEYGHLGAGITNGTVAEIRGRYPESGWGRNKISDELVYVISGNGTIEMPNKVVVVSEGDVAFIPKGQKIAWNGKNLKVFIPCIPAWTNQQHELIK